MKKILYGVCGIGSGHTYRQLPLIEHFSKSCLIVIFAYGASYDFYSEHFKSSANIKVVLVAVPFYVADEKGIDFKATEQLPRNQNQDFDLTNKKAEEEAFQTLGIPDLVISDYEPVSAQYAYEHEIPLVTIDQQSKYLFGDFPDSLSGFSYGDEVARLLYFFPRANARIACSFFHVRGRIGGEMVKIVGPILKENIIDMKKNSQRNSILVYISAARAFQQSSIEIAKILQKQPDTTFHIFLGDNNDSYLSEEFKNSNLKFYKHGDKYFYEVIKECSGIISTPGHSLLSESLYLGIPVYAIPVEPYEQHMNAYVIDQYGFGISHKNLNQEKLTYFIKNINKFRTSIETDNKILIRTPGQIEVVRFLEKEFLNK